MAGRPAAALIMLCIRNMTEADIPLGMALTREEGWNQTEADWRRFLTLEPHGCFVAEHAGEPVGTTTTCVLGRVGWIAMVLVAQAHRGRGLGTALMERALEYLQRRGVRSLRLDATAAGRPLYERLGFVGEYQVVRWGGTPQMDSGESRAQVYGEDYLEPLAALDREATGADRRRLLSRLAEEYPEAAWFTTDGGQLTAYLLARRGAVATQIGPSVAAVERDGRALLTVALAQHRGRPVLVDIPEDNEPASSVVRAAGLTAQRTFTRMGQGEPVRDRVELLWACSGPEKG